MANTGFDANKEIVHIVDDIRHYFVHNGGPNTKAVIGISGGKDSTVAAALLVEALGAHRVVGVLMPQGEQKDINDSLRVCEYLGIEHHTINIGFTCNILYEDFLKGSNFQLNAQIETNAPARIRMNVLYMVASAVGGRVINTGNRSEAYVGYTTKYGDLAGDYAVLRDYYVTEIYEIGDALKLPRELVHKVPSDGMSSKSDEDNMGFTYQELDDYLVKGITPSANVLKNIVERHNRNRHKEVIRLPHPCSITRPYVRHNDYFHDEDNGFSF